jgi:hypothetical protein
MQLKVNSGAREGPFFFEQKQGAVAGKKRGARLHLLRE